MNNVLGIVFSNMHDYLISELTAVRCMGSVPVGGRYRMIDFALSGFVNSQIENVGIVTKSNYQSLMDHLGSGTEWDLSRRHGGLTILPPFGSAGTGGMYRGKVEAFHGIKSFVRKSPGDYVLSVDCDFIANIDYTDFIEQHLNGDADISVMYKKMQLTGEKDKDYSTFLLDGGDVVREMLINPEIKGEQNVFLNVMMISKDLLERVVSACYSRNQFSFDKDVLQAGMDHYKIKAYEFTGHVARIDSMKAYYAANMALLEPQVREALFPRERPIFTKIRDEAPVRYGLKSHAVNSLIADGCIIDGEVENSLLFRGVKVARGASVKNSIVMQGSEIGANSSLNYVITDKDVTIKDNRTLTGFETYPVFISKGSSV
jgi:glucose-1-phosphate adenylyltransferase